MVYILKTPKNLTGNFTQSQWTAFMLPIKMLLRCSVSAVCRCKVGITWNCRSVSTHGCLTHLSPCGSDSLETRSACTLLLTRWQLGWALASARPWIRWSRYRKRWMRRWCELWSHTISNILLIFAETEQFLSPMRKQDFWKHWRNWDYKPNFLDYFWSSFYFGAFIPQTWM